MAATEFGSLSLAHRNRGFKHNVDTRSTIYPPDFHITSLLRAHRQTHTISTTVCRLLPLCALEVVSVTPMTIETQWPTHLVQETVNPTSKSILYDITAIMHYFNYATKHRDSNKF